MVTDAGAFWKITVHAAKVHQTSIFSAGDLELSQMRLGGTRKLPPSAAYSEDGAKLYSDMD